METHKHRLSGFHWCRIGLPPARGELHLMALVALAGFTRRRCPGRRRRAGARTCPRGVAWAATAAITPSLAAQPEPPRRKRRGADPQVCFAKRHATKGNVRLSRAGQAGALPRPRRGQAELMVARAHEGNWWFSPSIRGPTSETSASLCRRVVNSGCASSRQPGGAKGRDGVTRPLRVFGLRLRIRVELPVIASAAHVPRAPSGAAPVPTVGGEHVGGPSEHP